MMVQKHKNTKTKNNNLARFTYQTYYSKISILNIYFLKKPYRNNVPSKHINPYTKYVLINKFYLLKI
jgi:hypothetical protein